ncbi:MAG: metallophosphoesterase, partial [Armatimonadetes bacterium]|nr:metallophosphoesterase [Candidatus Hippobium faecium]
MKIILSVLLLLLFSCAVFCEKSMIEFNPEFEDRIVNAEKTFDFETKTFALFAFTDLHSGDYEFNRLMEFYSHYSKYFDNAICLGDILENYAYPYEFIEKNPYSHKVLMVIGNHDVFNGSWGNIVSPEDCFNRFYSPFIAKWGAVYEEGKTYYYKDYPDKNIRLIVLDSMLNGKNSENQLLWFKNTLNDTKGKKYHVIVAAHFPILTDSEPLDCPFATTGRAVRSTMKIGESETYAKLGFIPAKAEEYQIAVDDFRKGGGVFVTWLAGHIHYDTAELDKKYNQLCIAIEAANMKWANIFTDSNRVKGLKCQDLADAIVVDTTNRVIKILRVGCDTDRYMKHRDMTAISYA